MPSVSIRPSGRPAGSGLATASLIAPPTEYVEPPVLPPPPPQAARQSKAPAANGLAIHIGIPPMQRLLSKLSTLQFVDYMGSTAGATALRLSASVVRKL